MKFLSRIKPLYIAIIAALVGILLSVGKPVMSPFSTHETACEYCEEIVGENGSIVICNSQKELLFLNGKGQIVNVISPGLIDFDQDRLYVGEASGDGYYIAIRTIYPGDNYSVNKSVLKYTSSGSKSETLWSEDFSLSEGADQFNSLMDIYLDDENCYALRDALGGDNNIYLDTIPLDREESDEDDVTTVSLGQLPDSAICFDAVKCRDSETFIALDLFGELYKKAGSDAQWEQVPVDSLGDITSDYVIVHNEFRSAGSTGLAGKSIPYSATLLLRVWYFWISVAAAAVIAVYISVKAISNVIKSRNAKRIKQVGYVTAFIACFCALLWFVSYRTLEGDESSRLQELAGISALIQSENSDLLTDINNEFMSSGGKVSSAKHTELENILGNIDMSQAKVGLDIGILILSSDNRVIADSNYKYPVGYSYGEFDYTGQDDFSDAGISCVEFSDDSQRYIGVENPIADSDGNTSCSVFVFTVKHDFNAQILNQQLKLMLDLFIVMVFIFYVVSEIKAWLDGYLKHRRLSRSGESYVGVFLTRPLMWLSICCTGVDSALIVIITRQMLEGTAYDSNAVLISLPLTIVSGGYICGSFLFDFLIRKYPAGRIIVTSALLMLISFFVCAFAVYNDLFILFLAGLIVLNTNIELPLMYCQTLVVGSPTEGIRKELNIAVSASVLSAKALITIIAGYAAELIGNYAVYLVGALFNIAMLALVIPNRRQLPSEIGSSPEPGSGSHVSDILHFLGRPAILVMIFCLLFGQIFADSYQKFIFPMLATDFGLGKSVISNIQVFASALMYLSYTLTGGLSRMLGGAKTSVLCLLMVSFLFLLLVLNSSMLLSIVMLVLVYICSKSLSPVIAEMWQADCKRAGVSGSTASFAVNTVDNVTDTVKNPILGFLYGLGSNILNLFIAVYLAAGAVVIGLWSTKKGKK